MSVTICSDCHGTGKQSLEACAIDRTVKVMEYPCPTCWGTGRRPTWEENLVAFAELPEGWDSHGAKPIHPRAITRALMFGRVLVRLGIIGAEHLIAVPCPNGNVQLEAHYDGIDWEIEIGPREDQR